MLMNINGDEISSIGYNSFTKELKVVRANGEVRYYYNVPQDIYEKIKNNGGLISDAINETLNANYKSSSLL